MTGSHSSCIRVQGKALILKKQLPVRQRVLIRSVRPPQAIRRRLLAPVNGRGVPPMRNGINVSRRPRALQIGVRIRRRARDFHSIRSARCHKRIIRLELKLESFVPLHFTMAKPVVRLKLNPCGGEKVERARRNKRIPCKQSTTHLTRARLKQSGLGFRKRVFYRHIPAKAFSCGRHFWEFEVIVFSIRPARHQIFRRAFAGALPGHQIGRVMQISLAQEIA